MKKQFLFGLLFIASVFIVSGIVVYGATGDREIQKSDGQWKTLEREVSLSALVNNQKVVWNLTAENLYGTDIYRHVQIDVPTQTIGDSITINKVYVSEETRELVIVLSNSRASTSTFNLTVMVGKIA